jgi:hypothetical protein
VFNPIVFDGGSGTGLSLYGQDLKPATVAARTRLDIVAVGGMSPVGREWNQLS